ncbi:lysophospholipid acyltransferase family protein [Mycoplasmopsis opalescens]|uniref:lysophospholipid acyltransferase family protein n=1 Tax=Mycoplasmopsis opalescens TaxID=114886 RepID=UPI0004A717F2|nr:lysophospholipid acyltransferase family protein [Mycoplasmopsis opalescens]
MGYIFKMIFFWWYFLFLLLRVKAKTKSYEKAPDQQPQLARYNYFLKVVKRIFWFYNIKVKVEGYKDLPKGPLLLVPNHKSNIDPLVMIYALQKQTKEEGVEHKVPTFLAKIELTKKRINKRVLNYLDTFYVDRNNPRQAIKALHEFGAFIREKRTCGVIFPESTRVTEDGLGEFKPGAFKPAYSNYLPIVPVAISDTRQALNKKRNKKLIIKVNFLKPIKPQVFMTMDASALADKVKNQIEGALSE